MKNRYCWLLYLALTACIVSCNDDTTESGNGDGTVLEPETELIDVPAEGTKMTVQVKSNGVWTAATSGEWCRVDKSLGFQDDSFTLTVDENTDYYSRETSVKLAVGADKIVKLIRIVQTAQDYSLPESISFGKVAEPQKLFINAATAWSATIIDKGDGTEWVSITPESGTAAAQATVSATPNDTGSDREAALQLTIDGETTEISIIQRGSMDAPVITLTDNDAVLSIAWEEVVGAATYKIEAYDASMQLVGEDAIANTVRSYDISKIPQFIAGHENFYTGPVTIKLLAVASDPAIFTESNSVTAHSHYDAASGDGTSEQTAFVVTRSRHLNNVRQNPNAYFRQENDIDLTSFDDDTDSANGNFKAIETFTGYYDGAGHKIANLKITAAVNAGLFSNLTASGVLKNITLTNPVLNCTSTSKTNNAGALVCLVSTDAGGGVFDCHTEGGSVSGAYNNIGGLIGATQNQGDIEGCSNRSTAVNGEITATTVGGLIGYVNNTGRVENCSNAGNVSAYNAIGGLCGGLANTGVIRYCHNSGTVHNRHLPSNIGSGKPADIMAGGLTPRIFNTSGRIECSYNTGEVKCAYYLGGISAKLGSNNSVIENCYNQGTLTVTEFVAGATTLGGISGTLSINAGGDLSSTVKNCYAVGTISLPAGASVTERMGGIVGYRNANNAIKPVAKINGVYFLSDLATPNAVGENAAICSDAPQSAAALKQQATFAGWDFSEIWTIDEGTAYPVLRPQDNE